MVHTNGSVARAGITFAQRKRGYRSSRQRRDGRSRTAIGRGLRASSTICPSQPDAAHKRSCLFVLHSSGCNRSISFGCNRSRRALRTEIALFLPAEEVDLYLFTQAIRESRRRYLPGSLRHCVAVHNSLNLISFFKALGFARGCSFGDERVPGEGPGSTKAKRVKALEQDA